MRHAPLLLKRIGFNLNDQHGCVIAQAGPSLRESGIDNAKFLLVAANNFDALLEYAHYASHLATILLKDLDDPRKYDAMVLPPKQTIERMEEFLREIERQKKNA